MTVASTWRYLHLQCMCNAARSTRYLRSETCIWCSDIKAKLIAWYYALTWHAASGLECARLGLYFCLDSVSPTLPAASDSSRGRSRPCLPSSRSSSPLARTDGDRPHRLGIFSHGRIVISIFLSGSGVRGTLDRPKNIPCLSQPEEEGGIIPTPRRVEPCMRDSYCHHLVLTL